MTLTLTKVVELGANLNPAERNLLSIAFKNSLNPKRIALRTFKSLLNKEEARKSKNASMLRQYKAKLIGQVLEECEKLVKILDDKLIIQADSKEGRIFYLKMRGDYYRYMAEADEVARRDYSEQSSEAYKHAFDESLEGLPSTHPIRLGLALNYSVYFYEICGDAAKACKLSK